MKLSILESKTIFTQIRSNKHALGKEGHCYITRLKKETVNSASRASSVWNLLAVSVGESWKDGENSGITEWEKIDLAGDSSWLSLSPVNISSSKQNVSDWNPLLIWQMFWQIIFLLLIWRKVAVAVSYYLRHWVPCRRNKSNAIRDFFLRAGL